jgi:hypothetical protein
MGTGPHPPALPRQVDLNSFWSPCFNDGVRTAGATRRWRRTSLAYEYCNAIVSPCWCIKGQNEGPDDFGNIGGNETLAPH